MRIVADLLVDYAFNAIESKGFSNYTYIGDPLNACKIMSDLGVDEVVFTRKKTSDGKYYEFDKFDLNYIANCGLSASVKGGIQTDSDAVKLISSGFDRVGINASKLTKSDKTVRSLISKYGSQAIFVYYESNGPQYDDHHLKRNLDLATELGCGEFIFIDCNNDGKLLNYKSISRFLDSSLHHNILKGFYGEVVRQDCGVIKKEFSQLDSLILSTDLFRSHRNNSQPLHSFDFEGVSQRATSL